MNIQPTAHESQTGVEPVGADLLHKLLIEGNRAETRRFRKMVLKMVKRKSKFITAVIIHEDDESCCTKESWQATCQRVIISIMDRMNASKMTKIVKKKK